MAQQQDPNADPLARGQPSPQGVAAGSQDTYRPKGFTSPETTPPAGALNGITAPPGMAPAETYSWGRYSGAKTPGVLAATGAGGSGQPGVPTKDNNIMQTLGDPLGKSMGGIGLYSFLGNALGLEKNNSQLQDIGGALYQGLPISDADWMRAGFGPGGAPLAAPQAQPTGLINGAIPNTLRAITGSPTLGTTPANAIMRSY